MNRRLLTLTLLVATLAAPAVAHAAQSPATIEAPTAATTATPGPPGIQVGPSPPGSTVPPTGTTTVGGDSASHPAFWDVSGQVRNAINNWFKSLVLDALTPTLDLVGKTVLSTLQLTGGAQIAGLWQIRLIAADGLLNDRMPLGRPLQSISCQEEARPRN
jgi:hypothetical protein